jgi:tagatose-6-phosphate ketose/aldose isomerase
MKYLNINEKVLKKAGAIHTAKEISGQPELWSSIFDKVILENDEIGSFLDFVFKNTKKIVLTGAGTSAYIGHSIQGFLQRKSNVTTVSVPTTHLVSHPRDYFETSVPTLLISFARSGNSPESVAAATLADKFCEQCYHLIITCNPDGNLAKFKFKDNGYVFILPPEADDQSLAMTGSYSGMLLSALLFGDIVNVNSLRTTIDALKCYGNAFLTKYLEQIEEVAALPFTRAIFLGSGPQYGTGMESQLKVQELTDGKIICKNDSYLGFRHGPKAVVDNETLLVYYFSNKKEVLQYEKDLVNGMSEGKIPLYQIGVAESRIEDISIDLQIVLSDNDTSISEEYLAVTNILLGQILGFYKSLNCGLSPDSPSVSGAISRVVHGVIIY